MKRISLDSITHLEDALSKGYWSNGKNMPVDHLHETGATSRFPKENIYGIYLANEAHTWMAFWIAVTDRAKIRKRALRYISSDSVGTLEINTDVDDPLCDQAYLYLFHPDRYRELEHKDIRPVPNTPEGMLDAGFYRKSFEKKGVMQENYHFPTACIVNIDNWQLVISGIPRIIPDIELVLTPQLIQSVNDRVRRTTEEIGEQYIVYTEGLTAPSRGSSCRSTP